VITSSRYGSGDISTADAGRGAAWMLGTTLFLALLAVSLQKLFGPSVGTEALLNSGFFIALTISTGSAFLRSHSRAARVSLIALLSVAWYGFFLAVALLGRAG